MLRQAVSEQQQATEGQLSELADTIKALEARLTESSSPAALLPAPTPVVEVVAAPSAAKEAIYREEEVTPEILVVIAAAVTAFMGKKVRIRSAKMLRAASEAANPWSQQGRVSVHTSHNLRLRG
jgi:methylmalonyl-CoA carboxyltransferase large subunit